MNFCCWASFPWRTGRRASLVNPLPSLVNPLGCHQWPVNHPRLPGPALLIYSLLTLGQGQKGTTKNLRDKDLPNSRLNFRVRFASKHVETRIRITTTFSYGCVGSKGSSYELNSLEWLVANTFCLFLTHKKAMVCGSVVCCGVACVRICESLTFEYVMQPNLLGGQVPRRQVFRELMVAMSTSTWSYLLVTRPSLEYFKEYCQYVRWPEVKMNGAISIAIRNPYQWLVS